MKLSKKENELKEYIRTFIEEGSLSMKAVYEITKHMGVVTETQYDKYENEYLIKWEDFVFLWNDNATIDCPEDLTWNRMLSNIFNNGIQLGMFLARRLIEENKS